MLGGPRAVARQGNSHGGVFSSISDWWSGCFLLCRTRRRPKAKKLRRPVWRRAFHWSRHAGFDDLVRRTSIRVQGSSFDDGRRDRFSSVCVSWVAADDAIEMVCCQSCHPFPGYLVCDFFLSLV